MHGLGNDFIVFDARRDERNDYSRTAKLLCGRRTGIGADGLIAVCNSNICDTRMRIINSDGSEAEMCGNGIRVFSKYVYERGIVNKPEFEVETLAGVMRPKLTISAGTVTGITVDMGKPSFDRADIPMTGRGTFIMQELKVLNKTFKATSMLLGVPHTVVFVQDVRNEDIVRYGRDIEQNELFPKGTNVNFVHVTDEHSIEVRTFERGCGATLACGTGTSASAVACALSGLTGRKVDAHLKLGILNIEWLDDGRVTMSGPAEAVFDGEIDPSLLEGRSYEPGS
ncbi:MAG: Diaminopimelate epimerase [Firmicutes bacterium ADurb.Bin182]|nr:MAG: Diaminopimelate epimerase [Firmicutes bacterium ADurb.Bin182]